MAEIVEIVNAQGELVEVGGPPDPAPETAPPPVGESSAPDPPPAAETSATPAPADPAQAAPPPQSEPASSDADVPYGVQRRIDQMTRRLYDERRQYEQQMAELRGQVEMLTRLTRGEEPPPAAPREPVQDAYASHEEYLAALVDFRTEQRVHQALDARDREARMQAEQAEQFQRQQALLSREATLRQQHADYDEQISTLGMKGMSPMLYNALLAHELGPDLAYYLASNEAELRRLSPLAPLQVWRELGKLEARLTPPTAAGPPAVTVTSAHKPAPLTPVGSGGNGAPPRSLDDTALSQREWEQEAERQYPGIFSRRR